MNVLFADILYKQHHVVGTPHKVRRHEHRRAIVADEQIGGVLAHQIGGERFPSLSLKTLVIQNSLGQDVAESDLL